MHTFIKRALLGTLLAGGLTLLSATVANAAETTGEDGLLSGNQALVQVTAPVTVADNATSVVGDSTSLTAPAAPAGAPPAAAAAEPTTSGEGGIASGNQVVVDVEAPIDVTGNAVSGIGDSTAVTTAPAPPAATTAPAAPATSTAPTTSGEDGILSGNQVVGSVNAPVDVSRNAVSGIGDSTVVRSGSGGTNGTSTPGGSGGIAPITSGEDGIASGNQIIPVITAPVNVSGNAVSGIGDSTVVRGGSGGTNGTSTPGGSGGIAPITSGE
ncbi:chaplin family protein, partial [Microbacterium sp.]|uniref:chaplin family protein n=1 Tax=Microbacterium sp. TaxID=51671 RepID=UPI002E35A404